MNAYECLGLTVRAKKLQKDTLSPTWGVCGILPISPLNLGSLSTHSPQLTSLAFPPSEGVTPILWPPDSKSPLVRKDPDAGKD